jgi:endonuclease YncB( thermonuclease family)
MRAFILFLLSLFPALAADPFTARVVRVTDGDTITVEAPGHIVKVRLFGIDCPESKQDGGPRGLRRTRSWTALYRSSNTIQTPMAAWWLTSCYPMAAC